MPLALPPVAQVHTYMYIKIIFLHFEHVCINEDTKIHSYIIRKTEAINQNEERGDD